MLEMTKVAPDSGAFDFGLTERERSYLMFVVFRLEVFDTLAQSA
jgi:hypothetical protein